jgi:hypothetical protein
LARFDLSQYATVAERLDMLYAAYPDARIITENLTTDADREKKTWVVSATLYLNADDQKAYCAKSTGHAFEIDGSGGANATSALENAETSAVGRCLALANWNGNRNLKSLASREEMMKVERAEQDWRLIADGLSDIVELRKVYADARKLGASVEVLKYIEEKASGLESAGGA